ncbi:glycosyltransferase family 2 protein [Arundinibacter roseus]|uniref:Glycosyltransferase family 2 protein n=1 Tax=Arundinibacter roseus TaxID=2070510 RepID=A0A4R4K7E6_9BACT|nr:glycosyltransferase family A protein [Arundinibacter roseus]TDB63468.1 glycosyltransferase family 2 protein [Arundinibacter roseus]
MDSISVIIPTWNRADTLEKCIRSVLAQTIEVSEILICDDGSTDDSEKVVAAISDPRIVWIPGNRSGGPATPRNRGVAISTSEWLAFLDSDDAWAPEKLATQLTFAKENKFLAVCSNGFRVLADGAYSIFHGPEQCIKGLSETLTFETLLQINFVICSSVILHKTLLKPAFGFPEQSSLKAVEDYALWLRIASTHDFGYLLQPMVLYRDTPQTSIRKGDSVEIQKKKIKEVYKDLLAWNQEVNLLNTHQKRLVNQRIKQVKCGPFETFMSRIKRLFIRSLFSSGTDKPKAS